MTKQTIRKSVDSAPCISQDQTLQELKNVVDALIDKYGSDANYRVDHYEGYADESIEIIRLETDAEYRKRIDRFNRIKEQTEEKERKEFERLKAKYGSQ